jgi:hypothetical protein
MRYRVLNNLFWQSSGDSMGMHYRSAMDWRGWRPDWESFHVRKRAERAGEEGGPRNDGPDSSQQARDQ